MKNKNLLMTVAGIGISLVVLYATIYVAGKGWKKSQEK